VSFSASALAYLSAKTASQLGGDLRDIFQICKEAVKKGWLREGEVSIGIEDIEAEAEGRVSRNARVKTILALPRDQKTLVCSLICLIKRDKPAVPLEELLELHNARRESQSAPRLCLSQLKETLEYLEQYGLVARSKDSVAARVSYEDISQALLDSDLHAYL
jgi:Cdc6-like AAA superfamily ATPase